MRLAFVTSHPIQYQAPLFRALAGAVELRVFFGWDGARDDAFDDARGFGRTTAWDVPLTAGYPHELLPNWALRPGTHRRLGVLSPGVGPALARFAPDVTLVHGWAHAYEWLALGASRALGVPTLVRGENTELSSTSIPKRFTQLAISGALRSLCDGMVTIGSRNRAYYLRLGVPEERLHFAPYAVDNAFFASRAAEAEVAAESWRAALGIGADEVVFGFAGKLAAHKGVADLLRGFARAGLPRAHLVIVGDGAERPALEAQARAAGLRGVHFVGFVNQQRMPEAYALCDVVALPSRFEPWGLVVNEALAMGRPVLVSDRVGSAPDLVAPSHGWVHPAGSVEAIAAALSAAAALPRPALRAMGAAGARHVAGWDIPASAAAIVRAAEAVYRVSAARRRPRSRA